VDRAERGDVPSRPRLIEIASALVLAAVLTAGVAVRGIGTWDPVLLGLVLALVVAADLVEFEYKNLYWSGSFLGLVLAMALLGPAQAALLGVLGTVVSQARLPGRRWCMVMNVANFAAFPFAGGLVMHRAAELLGVGPADPSFALALLAGFAVAYAVNTLISLAGTRFVDREPVLPRLRTAHLPMLPGEAVMIILASFIVYAEAHLGPIALALLGALFFLYLFLVRELLVSHQRGELLERRNDELAALQVGVLTAMLRTLSLRDRMTARHSAAVARYARAMARAHGCSEQEQDLVHTAGLLHDIGKFILPDHILLADTRPTEEDWNLIRMHPYQGARVVREVEGYGPVAEIILAHHERVGGGGYPRGIAGDEIPLFSRMISIADTYDVMTSRDSYRDPVSAEEAIAELRRVSGTQLDGELVELFVTVLRSEEVAFGHGDDADFEAELAFERRVRAHAAPRPRPLRVVAPGAAAADEPPALAA
jgi:putative nucleotidyltransferase with HDIG domain